MPIVGGLRLGGLRYCLQRPTVKYVERNFSQVERALPCRGHKTTVQLRADKSQHSTLSMFERSIFDNHPHRRTACMAKSGRCPLSQSDGVLKIGNEGVEYQTGHVDRKDRQTGWHERVGCMFGGGGFQRPWTPPPNDVCTKNRYQGSHWVSRSVAFSDLHQQVTRSVPIGELMHYAK
jgi:hypothetical protein